MKIALLADVHANLPALKAVLADIGKQRVEEIWDLGDFLGYGAYPEQVVALLKARAKYCLAGNYDLNVLVFSDRKRKWKRTKEPAKYFSFRWTHRHLSGESRTYVKELPSRLSVQKGGLTFLLVHGSPERVDEPLDPDTPEERLAVLAGKVAADVVLCGHTHRFFDRTVRGVRFINPGSVGRSFDADPRASYVVLDIRGGVLSVQQRRVGYNMKKMLKKMSREKFPKSLAEALAEGKSLDRMRDQKARNTGEKKIIAEVISLARSCDYEKQHSHQVTKLALALYDGLQELHGLQPRHRLLLQSASLLHDIGWIKGRIRHHKTARDIILKSFSLPLSREEKTIVALVARYHRRAIPKDTHKYYRDLDDGKKAELCRLAAMLRVADGLDHSYSNAVQGLACRIQPEKVVLEIRSDGFSEWDEAAAMKKADLFKDVFKKDLCLEWRSGQ